jgi:hypothetical protein
VAAAAVATATKPTRILKPVLLPSGTGFFFGLNPNHITQPFYFRLKTDRQPVAGAIIGRITFPTEPAISVT